jgi:RNA polymerase sigma factor (sigma-70 family)
VNLNMGSADRKLRAFVVAPVLVVAAVLFGPAGWLSIVLYTLAGVMLTTSAVGSCPLYMLFGLRTCPPQSRTTLLRSAPSLASVGVVVALDVRSRLAGEVPALLRYARTIVRDGHMAEDLVQETLLRALQRADSFRGDASLATWLHRILHNLAVDRLRADREDATEDIEREVEERWHDRSYTVDAAMVVERAETREELEDALVRLPVIYRTAVVLHDAEGMTVRAHAGDPGIPKRPFAPGGLGRASMK